MWCPEHSPFHLHAWRPLPLPAQPGRLRGLLPSPNTVASDLVPLVREGVASAELVLRDRPTPPCAAVTLAAHSPPGRQPRAVPAGHTSHHRPPDTSLPRGSGSKSGSPQGQGGGLCWAVVLGAQSHSQWAALRLVVPIGSEAGAHLP